ncbi:MAG: hypothetical protein ACPGQL_08100 [Thermoplasmatota archaeon]
MSRVVVGLLASALVAMGLPSGSAELEQPWHPEPFDPYDPDFPAIFERLRSHGFTHGVAMTPPGPDGARRQLVPFDELEAALIAAHAASRYHGQDGASPAQDSPSASTKDAWRIGAGSSFLEGEWTECWHVLVFTSVYEGPRPLIQAEPASYEVGVQGDGTFCEDPGWRTPDWQVDATWEAAWFDVSHPRAGGLAGARVGMDMAPFSDDQRPETFGAWESTDWQRARLQGEGRLIMIDLCFWPCYYFAYFYGNGANVELYR